MIVIPCKHSGYGESGKLTATRRVYSGGGGGGAPAQTTQTTTTIPEYAKPYVESTLGKAAALTDTGANPYKAYQGERIAQFTPMQQQAFAGAANMAPAQQTGLASDIAAQAGIGALRQGGYQPGQFQAANVQGPDLTQYQLGPAERVRSQDFTPWSAQQYMSPYMQSVVEMQQRDAARQAQVAGTQQQAQATQAGAFGGGRDAIMRAEAARNLALQQGDIQAKGLQDSYAQAQAQFNADQARRQQAALANQQAGINVGGQNLQAALGVQQFGAGQNLQAQLANQQAQQQAQQAAEQSRQFGSQMGLQGLQTALQGAGQLGQLGAQQTQQQMDINKLQQQYGTQQQGKVQDILSQQYQDFLNQQNYPYKQLGFMSDLLRGTSGLTQQSQSIYQAPPSQTSQLMGLGTAAYGMSKMAEGGEVKVKKRKPKAAGLADLAISKMA